LVLNCVRSDEASGRSVVWPRPEACQLLFNSEQDYEATLRLVPRSRSTFFLNNPGWDGGSTGTDTHTASKTPAAENPPVAPPRAARNAANIVPTDTTPTVSLPAAASFQCDDLLGLNSPPTAAFNSEQQLRGGITPTEDLLVGLSPPAVQESTVAETPAPTGFDFLADLSEPAQPTLPATNSQAGSQK
jgi:hypothetical protein